MQSYLFKPNKSVGIKKRFFVLEDSTLSYYETEAKGVKLAEIALTFKSCVSKVGDNQINIDGITVGIKASTKTSYVLFCDTLNGECDRWVESLQNACALTSTDPSYKHFGGIISQMIGDLIVLKLKKNKIAELVLDQVEIPDKIGVAIASALGSNTSLKTLYINIQMNSARTHELGDIIGLALAAAIEKQKLINDIHLGSCSFTNQTGLALAAAFEKNPILKKISLYNCTKVDDECISCIMAALEKSGTLEELALSEVLVGDHAGVAIASILSKQKHLKVLTVSQGTDRWASPPPPIMSDQSGLAIAAALQNNITLQKCWLNFCEGFTQETGNAFLESTTKNKTLKDLNLNGSKIDPSLCQEITRIFGQN
jgi:hypothetical protein